jgi:hypothetical protein
MLAPADPIAPSPTPPRSDALVARAIELDGPDVTSRIAEACVAAAGARNATLGKRWERIGVSLAMGGPAGVGNGAEYRRVDLRAGAAVRPAVQKALRGRSIPSELVRAPRALRLLSPVADRFSDSVLISNVGRTPMPGVVCLELFPVARGASAVAFGFCGIPGHPSTLSIRARDLTIADAAKLLDDVVQRLRAATRNA